jgi:hypothetical protein
MMGEKTKTGEHETTIMNGKLQIDYTENTEKLAGKRENSV